MVPILVLLCWVNVSQQFNVDIEHATHFSGPSSSSSGDYFGYSLALGEGALYAGAPAHGDSGAVFSCTFGTSSPNRGERTCKKIPNISKSLLLRVILLLCIKAIFP